MRKCCYVGIFLVLFAGLAMGAAPDPHPPKDPSSGGDNQTCGQCFAGCKFRFFDCMDTASTLTEKENCRV